MTSDNEFESPDLRRFIQELLSDATPEQIGALLSGGFPGALPGGGLGLPDTWHPPRPRLHPVPTTTRGFRIRVDLLRTKPPVWRRIEVPGDITLPRLHDVLQAAMGWTDSHLHRFRTGNGRNAPEFLTSFDLDEGDEGLLEDGVRLDQVVAAEGDRLWYEYDFGDGWEHVLRVEKVLNDPPTAPRCLRGRLACPPEDCGGAWGYSEIAEWVRSGFDDALRPEVFDSAEDGRAWLPEGWHPDAFDLEGTNAMITMLSVEPAPVTVELASLLEVSRNRGSRLLRDALADPASFGPTGVSADAAARLTEPLRVLLDVIGEGVGLTAAGYLKPTDVEQVARRTGIAEWWIGKVNREDLTPPVAQVRDTARALGLVSVRKGRITPTLAARRCGEDPEALLRHITGRLPLGKSTAERQFGWAALAVAGSETPAELWDRSISEMMFDLGWHDSRDSFAAPPAGSPTLDVLGLLAGTLRTGRPPRGVDADVAAAARAATRTP